MSGLPTPWWFLLSLAVTMPHLGLIALTKALRSYSRRRLEERFDSGGASQVADEIAHLDERTSRASEALSLVTGSLLALWLGIALARGPFDGAVTPILVILIAYLVLGYVAAGICGTIFAEAIIEMFWPLSGIIRSVALPLTFAIRQFERLTVYLSGAEESSSRPASVEVEVEVPAAESDESEDMAAELPDKAREMLEHAVKLTRTDVADIMTPRTEMVSLRSTASAKEAARIFRESGLSRIPMYGENRDDVVGILYAKDLFPPMTDPDQAGNVRPADLLRPPFFIPESKNAFELLEEFRAQRTQIAVILDEYGGVAGLVTLEDLLEELVGFIDDEHDEPTPANPIRCLGKNVYEIDGWLPIEQINEQLQLKLPTDDGYQTVGGLALHSLGRVPELGDTFRLGDVAFQVEEVSDHSVRRLILDLSPSQ